MRAESGTALTGAWYCMVLLLRYCLVPAACLLELWLLWGCGLIAERQRRAGLHCEPCAAMYGSARAADSP